MYGPVAVRYNGTTAPNHRELMAFYQAAFDERIAAGQIMPVVLPYHALGGFLVFVYLCIPHVNRPWLYALRWPIIAAVVAFNTKIILETRSLYTGSGFGVGLIASMGIIHSMAWLVWNDPQFTARRVEQMPARSPGRLTKAVESERGETLDGKASSGNGNVVEGPDGLRQRGDLQNGHSQASSRSKLLSNLTIKEEAGEEGKSPSTPAIAPRYHWQSYPLSPLSSRLDWIIDLLTSHRGTGWNWEIPTNPPLPATVLSRLGQPIDLASMSLTSPSSGMRRLHSRERLFRHHVPRFVVGYLLLDALRTFLPYDVYFLLGPEAADGYPTPEALQGWSALGIQFYRELLSCAAIITALETIFRLAPLVLCLLLGPRFLGVRGEPWHYPGTWGSFSKVQSHGLAGFWSRWWHQTFRFAFASPTAFFVRCGILPSRTHPLTKSVGLLVAFALSGFLHMAGSCTQLAATRPWDPFLFFMLQAVGIMIQTAFCGIFRGSIKRLPLEMRKAANTAFVGTWLFYTAPLLIDDFARGGLWLFQAVPISLFRGLGYGVPGDGWWCWGAVGAGDSTGLLGSWWWGRGGSWWESGVVVL